MATEVIDRGNNGVLVGIIIAVLALGLLIAYLMGAFDTAGPVDGDRTYIEESTEITPTTPVAPEPTPQPAP
jgi:hypothetical protein